MNLAQRIIEARAEKGLTQAELQKAAGIKQQSSIAMLETGERKRSTYIAEIASVLGVNALWLSSGKGEKYSTVSSDIKKERPSPCAIGRTVALMEQMDGVERDMLFGYVQAFFAQTKNMKISSLSDKKRAIISVLMLPEERLNALSKGAQLAIEMLEKESYQNLLAASYSGMPKSPCHQRDNEEMAMNATNEFFDNVK